MTRTKQILKLLVDGEPRTFKKIADQLGLPEMRVRNTIAELKLDGLIESVPLSYVITPDGEKRARWVPKTSEERIKKSTENRRKRRLAERLQANGVSTGVYQQGAQL